MGFRPYVSLVASFAKYLTNVHSSSCQVNGLDKFLQILADEARRGEGRGVLTYANHISVVDDPGVWGCMPFSAFQDSATTRWTLGASDILFTNRIVRLFFDYGQVIPTDRGRGIFQPALDTAIQKLDEGQWTHLFPEGYVNLSRKMVLRRFKWGLSRLLLESKRRPRVVPIWIEGFDQMMPDPRGFPKFVPRPFANLTITFGDPIDHAGSSLDLLLSDLRKQSYLNPAWWQDEDKEIERIRSALPSDQRPGVDAPAIPVPSPSSFPSLAPHVIPSQGWPKPPEDSPAHRAMVASAQNAQKAMASRSSLAELLRRELAALGVRARKARGEEEGAVGRLVHTLMPEEENKTAAAQASRSTPQSISKLQSRNYSTSSRRSRPSTSAASAASSVSSEFAPPTSRSADLASAGVLDAYNCFNSRAEPAGTGATTSTSGPLSGCTISVKDNICTRDMPTTASSLMLKEYASSYDATVVARLTAAGATIVGKTNCDEFGMGSDNVHSHFGPVINPAMGGREAEEQRRSAGGSSGGAAASVKAGYCRVGIGSDTGGSIRLPASYCGLWGLKPSYGLISRWGLISYADSLDTIGVLADNWSDCQKTLDVLSAYDEKDPTSVGEEVRSAADKVAEEALNYLSPSSGSGAAGSLKGLRIGIPATLFPSSLDAQVLPSFSRLLCHLEDSLGATIVPVELPSAGLALSAYYVIASAEASSNLARYDGVRYGFRSDEEKLQGEHPYAATRSRGFGDEVRRRILLGTHALSADAFDNTFLAAQRIRQTIKDEFDQVFRIPNVLHSRGSQTEQQIPSAPSAHSREGVDVLLHLSAVNTAPLLSALTPSSSSSAEYALAASASSPAGSTGLDEYVQDLLTVSSSLAGLPSVSMPLGRGAQDGWPVGMMATSQWGMEKVLGRLAEALQTYRVG